MAIKTVTLIDGTSVSYQQVLNTFDQLHFLKLDNLKAFIELVLTCQKEFSSISQANASYHDLRKWHLIDVKGKIDPVTHTIILNAVTTQFDIRWPCKFSTLWPLAKL